MDNNKQSSDNFRELLIFFKALSEANRLRIISLLAGDTMSVEQLAALLNLRPSTVSNHLSHLAEAGLVSARAEGYYNMYRLETTILKEKARHLLDRETLPAITADVDLGAYDRKIVADYSLQNGRLKIIPAQRRKLEAILRYVVRNFESGLGYTESQVNEILSDFHEDVATLRRELVGCHLLARQSDGGEYWRVEEGGKGKKKKKKG
jgi:predicted transcriptional regulator